MGQDDRDKKFEQGLTRHLRRAEAIPGSARVDGGEVPACPDAEMLAAFHERMLTNEEMNAAKEHVAGCSRCQEILALLENTDHIVAVNERGQLATSGLENVDHPRASVLSTGALYARHAYPTALSPAGAESPANAVQAPTEISSGRGFRMWRWVAPAGAIAAGLLIWVVAREPKYHPLSPSGNLQVAQEQGGERPAGWLICGPQIGDGSCAANCSCFCGRRNTNRAFGRKAEERRHFVESDHGAQRQGVRTTGPVGRWNRKWICADFRGTGIAK